MKLSFHRGFFTSIYIVILIEFFILNYDFTLCYFYADGLYLLYTEIIGVVLFVFASVLLIVNRMQRYKLERLLLVVFMSVWAFDTIMILIINLTAYVGHFRLLLDIVVLRDLIYRFYILRTMRFIGE